MKPNRKQKDRIKNVYLTPLTQLWHNLRTMPIEDREAFKEYVSKFDEYNCSWINYHAKYLLLYMLKNSDCYHE